MKTHKDYLTEQMLDAEFAEVFLREQRLLAERSDTRGLLRTLREPTRFKWDHRLGKG